jgi:hypothetical protein
LWQYKEGSFVISSSMVIAIEERRYGASILVISRLQ